MVLRVRDVAPYTLAAGIVVAAMITQEFNEYKQFYPTLVAVSHSSISMTVIFGFLCALGLTIFAGILQLFFGELRRVELSNIRENLWYSIFEALMALTMFRDEMNVKALLLFAVLLGFKIILWVLRDRVDFMLQTVRITWRFHLSIIAATMFVLLASCSYVLFAAHVVYTSGISVQVLFGFEYLMLIVHAASNLIKYLIYTIDLRRVDPWERRALYLALLDIVSDFIRLVAYVAFFAILVNFYTVPLHLMRDLFVTFSSFVRRVRDFTRARRVLARLGAALTDATPDDLRDSPACNICLEDMDAGKKLPCGHVFHLNCLRRWLQENQTCPACRADLDLLTRNRNRRRPPPPQQRPQQQQQQAGQQQQPPPPAGPEEAGEGGAGARPHTPRQLPRAPAVPPLLQQQLQQHLRHHQHLHHHHHQHHRSHEHHQQQQQQQQGGAETGGEVGEAGEETATGPVFPATYPPFPPAMPPPFGAMPPPPPPPPPPFVMEFDFERQIEDQNLAALTDAELAEMEGSAREKVKKRIQFLQRMQRDIDALTARFGQYLALPSAAAPVASTHEGGRRRDDDDDDDDADDDDDDDDGGGGGEEEEEERVERMVMDAPLSPGHRHTRSTREGDETDITGEDVGGGGGGETMRSEGGARAKKRQTGAAAEVQHSTNHNDEEDDDGGERPLQRQPSHNEVREMRLRALSQTASPTKTPNNDTPST